MANSHTMKWKQKEVSELKKLFSESKVVAIADLSRFPADLFGEIRKKLAGKATVRVTKTRIAMRALKESKFKDSGISEHLNGPIAIVFTDLDPFQLYMLLKKYKGKAPAKPGMVAENDIVVPAGDTGLPPGPALSDLKAAGLPVMLKGSSIKLSADKVVTKKGEVITPEVARALSKLDIKPVEIGLKVTAAVEGTQVFKASVLDLNLDKTLQDIIKAYSDSLNLSVSIAFPNKANISILVAKSFREAKNVALEAEYLCKETAPGLFGKAKRQAEALNSITGFSRLEESKEETGKPEAEKKQEAPAEEKPTEEPKKEETKEEKEGVKETSSSEEKEPVKETVPVEKNEGSEEMEAVKETKPEEKPPEKEPLEKTSSVKKEESKEGKEEKEPVEETVPVEKKESSEEKEPARKASSNEEKEPARETGSMQKKE